MVAMGDADQHTSKRCPDAGRNKVVRFDASILKNDKLTNIKSNSKFIMVPNTKNKVTGLEDVNIHRHDRIHVRNELNTFLRVRVLLSVLERRNPKLREQALQALRVCSRAVGRRRALPEKIESTLRLIAGEENWALACDIQHRIEKRNLKGKASSAKQGRMRAA